MANQTFTLSISRVNGPLFAGEASAVTIPAASGEMQILAHHEPLITPIMSGTISVTKADESTESFEVMAGTLEVSNNQVTILV